MYCTGCDTDRHSYAGVGSRTTVSSNRWSRSRVFVVVVVVVVVFWYGYYHWTLYELSLKVFPPAVVPLYAIFGRNQSFVPLRDFLLVDAAPTTTEHHMLAWPNHEHGRDKSGRRTVRGQIPPTPMTHSQNICLRGS